MSFSTLKETSYEQKWRGLTFMKAQQQSISLYEYNVHFLDQLRYSGIPLTLSKSIFNT